MFFLEGNENAKVPDPSDRLGLFLSGLPWIGQVQAESRVVPGKWQAWGPPTQIQNTQASGTSDSIVIGQAR
jgi:hypothetical protein